MEWTEQAWSGNLQVFNFGLHFAKYCCLRYPSGAIYEGEWKDNEKTGRGVYYFKKASFGNLTCCSFVFPRVACTKVNGWMATGMESESEPSVMELSRFGFHSYHFPELVAMCFRLVDGWTTN